MAGTSPLSMFDVQPGLSYADQAQQQQQAAYQYATMTPQQRTQYNMFNSAQIGPLVGDALNVGVAAATGQPVQNPRMKMEQVRQRVQAALQGVDASDPTKVYPTMIKVMQDEGMVSQAMALQKEYEEITNKRRDDARAQAKDQATQEYHDKLIASRDPRSPLSKSIEMYQKALTARDATQEGSTERKNADAAVKAYEEQLFKQHKIVVQDTPDATFILDPTTGAEIRRFSHTMRPTSGSTVPVASDLDAQAQAIADYRMPPPSTRMQATPAGAALMARVLELRPDYDVTKYVAKSAAEKNFTSGPQSNMIRAAKNANDHLSHLGELAQHLGSGNMPAANSVFNWFSQQSGGSAVTDMNTAIAIVGPEVVKAIVQNGGGVQEREEAKALFKPNMSPQQLADAITTARRLIQAQVNNLEAQRKSATDLARPRTEAPSKPSYTTSGWPK